jgi:NAD(P)-dependent dehydrogenase (short-subunit alcohol dehydrogenase family)
MSNTVVITGANRGLGLELARSYADRGDVVIAGCRSPDAAISLAAITHHVHAVDMGDENSINSFIDEIADDVSGGPVDILINNAGLDARSFGAGNSERDVLTQAADHFMGQIRVNTLGPMLLSRGLLPHLRLSDRPRIVNVSSQVGSMEVGRQIGSDVGYSTSKAALNMVTIKLANAVRDDGIIAMMIHPGHLRTDMGGVNAAMATTDAVPQILDLVDGLTMDDTGTFRRWDGTIHPW